MLNSLWIENFKSFRERSELPLSELTVLLGANASGKSNALEALQLIRWLAFGHRISDLGHAIRNREIALRHISLGEPEPDRWFALGAALGQTPEDPALELEMRFRGNPASWRWSDLEVIEESLDGIENGVRHLLYRRGERVVEHGSDVRVEYNTFRRGPRASTTCLGEQAVFYQMASPTAINERHPESRSRIPAAARRVRDTLSGICILDPSPPAMRGYSTCLGPELEADGANVSGVLYHCQDKQGILDFVRCLPEQEITDIEFDPDERNEVMLILVEAFGRGHRHTRAEEASDGTLRVLAVAAMLFSAPPGSLVVIEEIDNGVHPSRAEHLMSRIQSVAQSRGLRVLLTSHNPALLDALPAPAVPNAVVCFRDPESGSSRLIRIEDLPEYPALIARGPLGALATSGVLERYLKPHASPEERQARRRARLERLKRSEVD